VREFANLHDGDWLRRQLVAGGIALGFAAILATTGAYASDRYDPFQRIGYWTLLFLAWAVISRVALAALVRMSASRQGGDWTLLGAATVISLPVMLVLVALATASVSNWEPNAADMIDMSIGILVLGGAYLVLVERRTVFARGSAADETVMPQDDAPALEQPISGRLLERLRGLRMEDILGLGGEDHYVRVYTAGGSSLVLMRFADALEEVAGQDGLRVHRSWWVARGAVTRLVRDGRTARLELTSGMTVPVSQPYLASALEWWE
jgi:DNA-binding LytR/AlgR family response regulator